jgi:hypothetical protein
MAVDSTMFIWFMDLQEKFNIFGNASNILDFGPQGIWKRNSWGHNKREAKYLYKELGIVNYDSIDHIDKSATIAGDLNYKLKLSKEYDIVTDFGTMEHCFNIESFLRNMHEGTSDNGVMLHVVPTANGYNHGFYNFNSTLFLDLAEENNYEILDIRYVPSLSAQGIICNRCFSSKPGKSFKFYSITDMKILDSVEVMFFELLKMRLKIFFHLRLLPRRQYLKSLILNGDQLFVALRKKENSQFMFPSQGKYKAN